MIQEVSVESTQETPASSTLEPAEPEPLEPVPEEPQESQEPEEPEEPPPPPVPKTRVPPRVKPKAKAESTPSSSVPKAAPKVKAAPKAKRAPKKPEPEEPEPVDRFQAFSNTDLIAEILARTEDRRMEQKRQLYRSFLQWAHKFTHQASKSLGPHDKNREVWGGQGTLHDKNCCFKNKPPH